MFEDCEKPRERIHLLFMTFVLVSFHSEASWDAASISIIADS